jgi:tagaturonate reductase
MRVRVVPSIVRYAEQNGTAPSALAFGFAAYLELMRGELQGARRAAGLPVPVDVPGERVRAAWGESGAGAESDANLLQALVQRVCTDQSLWGADLTRAPGFAAAVTDHLARIRRDGIGAALEALLAGAAVSAA